MQELLKNINSYKNNIWTRMLSKTDNTIYHFYKFKSSLIWLIKWNYWPLEIRKPILNYFHPSNPFDILPTNANNSQVSKEKMSPTWSYFIKNYVLHMSDRIEIIFQFSYINIYVSNSPKD